MTDIEQIGHLGEKFVANILNAEISDYKYDMEKDLILNDGTHIEVKTQVRNIIENAFTVSADTSNQVKKCMSVDRLIFVEYGSYGNIRMYECIDRTPKFITTSVGRMASWNIDDMLLICDVRHKYADIMCKLSVTEEEYLDDSRLYIN